MTKKFFIFLLFYFQAYFIYSHEKKFFLGVTVANTPKTIKQQINYLERRRRGGPIMEQLHQLMNLMLLNLFM